MTTPLLDFYSRRCSPGSSPRLTTDGFLTLVTSPVGFGVTSNGSPRYPISGAKDGKSKMIFARSGRTRTGFALHKSGEPRHCARRCRLGHWGTAAR
jgi:hypothetical protein